jgi:hypothetical protein
VLSLLGYAVDGRCGWITSEVKAIDFEHGLVRTRNSLYTIRSPAHGEPPLEDLPLICATLHRWGVGTYLGVPEIFH